MLFLDQYEHIVCFSKYTYKFLKERYNNTNISYKYWEPYLPYYNKSVFTKQDVIYDFYSNGKSCRDIYLLRDALNTSKKYTGIILGIDVSSENCLGSSVISQSTNLKLLYQSKVVCVPVIKDMRGICGLTSINDALGARKPVLISDSCNLGFSVEDVGIGLEYKAGDMIDLLDKMKKILLPNNYNRMIENIDIFLKDHSYSDFSNYIGNLLRN